MQAQSSHRNNRLVAKQFISTCVFMIDMGEENILVDNNVCQH